MKLMKLMSIFAVVSALLIALPGCEKKSDAEKAVEAVGEGVEEMADDTKRGIENAADAVEKKID